MRLYIHPLMAKFRYVYSIYIYSSASIIHEYSNVVAHLYYMRKLWVQQHSATMIYIKGYLYAVF